jgi:hypothetical protein
MQRARTRQQVPHKCESPGCPHLIPPSSLRFCPGCRTERAKAAQ